MAYGILYLIGVQINWYRELYEQEGFKMALTELKRIQATLVREIDPPHALIDVLASREKVVAVFATARDYVAFTTTRIIIADVQGITGNKKELYSIPISKIEMWSTESKGFGDITAEIELWTRFLNIQIQILDNNIVRKIDRYMATTLIL